MQMHTPFLEHVVEIDQRPQADAALGGFLLTRLLARLEQQPSPSADAIAYQQRGLLGYVREVGDSLPETTRIAAVAEAVDPANQERSRAAVVPAALDYAFWLECELRLPEAVDLVETVERLSASEPELRVGVLMQLARLRRLVGDHERAGATYAAAGTLASEVGDGHSERLSRIGRAIVHQKLGDLPESERVLRTVLADARMASDVDAEARASHDLAVALAVRERFVEAIPLAFRAAELHGEEPRRLRALSDLGTMLRHLGYHAAAEDAFAVVLAGSIGIEMEVPTMLELLDLAAVRADEAAFRRWRSAIETCRDRLTPETAVEFEIMLGNGLALAGRRDEAEQHLTVAIERAQHHRLGESLFRAESLLECVREDAVVGREPAMRPPEEPDEVLKVARLLGDLRSRIDQQVPEPW